MKVRIPPSITQAIEWSLQREEYPTARLLAESYCRVLSDRDPAVRDFLASTLFKARFYKDAAQAALSTLELVPSSVEAKFNAAKCLNAAGMPDRAERLMREVLGARPDWSEGYLELGVYVGMQGRSSEAMRIFERAKDLFPSGSENRDRVLFNIGWHLINEGRFKEGMANLQRGRRRKIWGNCLSGFDKPRLERHFPLEGRTVLIRGEAGVGDELIGARFGRVIRERGGRTIWATSRPLHSLLQRVPGIDEVIHLNAAGEATFDYWVPCMDLPFALGLELHEVPGAPYLSADPSFRLKWKNKIPEDGNLKIGIRWQGNALYEQDLMRSVPFKLLERLAEKPGLKLYSLQRDEGSEERPRASSVVDLGPYLKTWEDTAAAISCLDLVISSCTAVPHLSAGMGKPTWLLCPLNCYYIWASPGDVSQWYSAIRLYRQRVLGSWAEPMTCLERDLSRIGLAEHL